MGIKPTDLISGTFFLKFVEDYKKYDLRQKELIEKLNKKISLLEWQVEDLKSEIDDLEDGATEKLRQKIRNQRTTLMSYMNMIIKQNKEIENLKLQNTELSKENYELKNELQNIKGA